MMTFTSKAMVQIVEKLVASTPTTGVFSAVQLMLYTNNVAVSPNLTITDLVEASFNGYIRQTITWSASARHSSETDAFAMIANGVSKFERTAGGVDQIVRGYAIVETGVGGNLLAVRALDTPETMEINGMLNIVPRLGLDPTAVIPSGDVTAT